MLLKVNTKSMGKLRYLKLTVFLHRGFKFCIFNLRLPPRPCLFSFLIFSSVTCSMQVMLGTQRATFTRDLRDTIKRRHLFQSNYSKEHNTSVPNNFLARFNVIKKCTNKFDRLVNEMRCIRELKPILKAQSDSLRAKVFM